MTDKYIILDNVEEYTAEQLVEFIYKGIITYIELKTDTNGQFDARKRKQVKKLLENGDSDTWFKVKQERTLKSVQKYIDTYPNGEFKIEAEKLLIEIQTEIERAKNVSVVDQAWDALDKKSIEAIKEFSKKYPNSFYKEDARKIINELILHEVMDLGADSLVRDIKEIQINSNYTKLQKDNNVIAVIKKYLDEDTITKEDFLKKIEEDKNLLSAGVVNRLRSENVIDLSDLVQIGIKKEFIQKLLRSEVLQTFDIPVLLDRIHKSPTTEVYFWGIPSSGKSCALGAILSAAASGRGASKSMSADIHSQGHGYMTKLMNLFKNEKVGTLMEGTSIDAFYEMGFDLIDNNSKKHPFTFIDMAGELMKCMYKENANEELSQKEVLMLDTLTKVLIDNSLNNRKLHIFVIEYGAENKLYEGLPQNTFLEGAASYIKNTGIFKKETDAVYLMITKTDKAKEYSPQVLNQYINENYLGFYNALEYICEENEINGGKVEKIAFSLGEVCFQNYCYFNDNAAQNVVNILLSRSKGFRTDRLGRALNILTR